MGVGKENLFCYNKTVIAEQMILFIISHFARKVQAYEGGKFMRECYVSFASAKEVHEFVSIATRQFFPIHVEQEDLRLNAKSIMSLFCMGLNRPFRVVIADADADPAPFWSAVEPYLVA